MCADPALGEAGSAQTATKTRLLFFTLQWPLLQMQEKGGEEETGARGGEGGGGEGAESAEEEERREGGREGQERGEEKGTLKREEETGGEKEMTMMDFDGEGPASPRATDYKKEGVAALVKARGGWLLVFFVGLVLAAVVVERFEAGAYTRPLFSST